MKILITGHTGTIGKIIYNYLVSNHIEIIPITRTHSLNSLEPFDYYNSIRNPISIDHGFLIHCGYDFFDKKINNNSNLIAVKNLSLSFPNVKIINISTLSAFDGCISKYGKVKLEIEKYINSVNGFNLRVGIPSHFPDIGFIKLIKKLDATFPLFFPWIGGLKNKRVYLTNLNELNTLIYSTITKKINIAPGTYSVVTKHPTNYDALIKMITHKRIIKIHWKFVFICFLAMELMGFKLRFGSDSVISIANSLNDEPLNIFE